LGGLAGSQANALGFETELLADGWQKGFNWGDEAAWESDWNKYDDSYVDAATLSFTQAMPTGMGGCSRPQVIASSPLVTLGALLIDGKAGL